MASVAELNKSGISETVAYKNPMSDIKYNLCDFIQFRTEEAL